MCAFVTNGELFDTYTNFAQYHKNVRNLEGLKEYLDDPNCRERTYQFNNKMAKINNDFGTNPVEGIMEQVYAKYCS